VEDRIEVLRRLGRKYGGTVEATLAAKDAMEEELHQLEHDDVRRAELASVLQAEEEALAQASATLRHEREAAATALETVLEAELDEMALAGARIGFRFRDRASPGPRGGESVEIEITPNPGESPRPLQKIASGGELSRVLLAFKRALADRAPARSYVFDEVDTGIGGAVAEVLGRKLREVSRNGQVVCITHLPQVAAQADAHFVVEKRAEADGRVRTRLRSLDAAARVHELARMLGGVRVTRKVRSAAEEMLARAGGAPPGGADRSPRTERPLR